MSRLRGRGVTLLLLGLVLLVGTATRLIGLDQYGFWFDEIFTANQVTFETTPRTIISFLAGTDAHPPGHYLVSWLWAHMVGIWGTAFPAVSEGTEFKLRLLSVLFGLSSIVFVMVFWRRMLGTWIAAATALWMAVSPSLVYQDREARMYPMLTLCVVVATYLLAKLIKGNSSRHAVILGALLAIALYTHYLGLFLWGGVLLGVLWSYSRTSIGNKLLALGLPLLAYSPWIPVLVSQLMAGRANVGVRMSADSVFGMSFYQVIAIGDDLETWWFRYLVFPLFWLAAAYAVFLLLRSPQPSSLARPTPLAVGIVFTGVVPFFAWYLISVFVVNIAGLRYLGIFLPPILASVLLGTYYLSSRIADRLRAPWVRVALTITAYSVLVGSSALSLHSVLAIEHEPWRELAAIMESRVETGETILFNEPGRIMSLIYYYRPEGVQFLVPTMADLYRLSVADRVWVVVKLFPTQFLLLDDSEGILEAWMEERENTIVRLPAGVILIESTKADLLGADDD